MSASLLSDGLLLAQNVPPKAQTPGIAQEPTPTPSGAGPQSQSPLAGLMPILMMLVVIVPFFLLMSRRQKKEAQARASLKKGDRVVSTAGLIGELVDMDNAVARVKVAPGVTLQILTNTLSPFTGPEKAQAKELKEAKAGPDKK